MERKDIKVFKLTHQYIDDGEICIKTNLEELKLVKLINALQVIAVDIEETFDLAPDEMRDLLFQYEGIRNFPNEEDLREIKSKGEDSFDFIEIDLYNVWEASNIKVTDDDILKYKNETILDMIKNFISDNNIAIENENKETLKPVERFS